MTSVVTASSAVTCLELIQLALEFCKTDQCMPYSELRSPSESVRTACERLFRARPISKLHSGSDASQTVLFLNPRTLGTNVSEKNSTWPHSLFTITTVGTKRG